MNNLFIKFLKDESGQTSTEYILLLAVVALIVFRFRNVAVGQIEKITGNIFSGADSISNAVNQAAQDGSY